MTDDYFNQPPESAETEVSFDQPPETVEKEVAEKKVSFATSLEEVRHFHPSQPADCLRTISKVEALDVDSCAEGLLEEEETRSLYALSTSPKRKGFVTP